MKMNVLLIAGLAGLLAWTNRDRIREEYEAAVDTYLDLKATQQAREDYETHLQEDDYYEDDDEEGHIDLEHPGDEYDDSALFTVMVKIPSPMFGVPPMLMPHTFSKAQLDMVRELANAREEPFSEALHLAIQDRLKML